MVTGRNTVLEAVGNTAAREYDVPEPPAGGLVLSMIRANVCGSDVHILNGGHPLVQPGCTSGCPPFRMCTSDPHTFARIIDSTSPPAGGPGTS